MNLSDELRSLTDGVPGFVHPDAGQAWRVAARRRQRRRVGAGLALVMALVVVLAGVRSLDREAVPGPATGPADGSPTQHALTLPTRIERPYVLHNLPLRAGRLAGLVWSRDQWLAVSPTGHLWRLPLATRRDYLPAISPDGSTVAFLQSFTPKQNRLLVWNTTTAILRFFSQVGTGETDNGKLADPATRFWIQSESPAYFSPDGKHLVVAGDSTHPGTRDRALLIDVSHGSDVTVIDSPAVTSTAFPAGWLDDSHLVWVGTTAQDPAAVVATLTGDVVRSVHLSMPKTQAAQGSQWVGPVSPDGRQVAFGPADGSVTPGSILAFPLDRDPSPYAVARVSHGTMGCPLSWGTSAAPAIPQTSPRLLSGSSSVVADPRLHVDCAIWASDALTGARHQGLAGALFGLNTAWWTWWWRELAIGLAVVVTGGFLLWTRRRRRSSAT